MNDARHIFPLAAEYLHIFRLGATWEEDPSGGGSGLMCDVGMGDL